MAHARLHGIALANGAGTRTDCVADHAIGLLIAAMPQIPAFDTACRSGIWRDALPSLPQLAHQHMGMLGLGSIAARIAQRAGLRHGSGLPQPPFAQ